jgi:aminoglycoside 6-adenylyltransferase
MNMLNVWIRSELHDMINWYIGTLYGFNLPTGKECNYIKKYLPPELYTQYIATYSGSNYTDAWAAIDTMCNLFHTLALEVASHFGFIYLQEEEDGIREYLRMVKEQLM